MAKLPGGRECSDKRQLVSAMPCSVTYLDIAVHAALVVHVLQSLEHLLHGRRHRLPVVDALRSCKPAAHQLLHVSESLPPLCDAGGRRKSNLVLPLTQRSGVCGRWYTCPACRAARRQVALRM